MQPAAALLLAILLGVSAVSGAGPVCQTYVVQPNDTVNIIAAKFNVTPKQLEDALVLCIRGYVPGSFLVPSQKMCLPGFVEQCANVQDAGGNQACKFFTVQQGDTMETIASYFSLPRSDVEAANPGLNPSTLPVASFVKLPPWGAECPAPGNTQSCRIYVAQGGDSLADIATSFNMLLTDVQAANTEVGGATDGSTILQPGQRIKLPPFPTDTCGAGVEVQKPSGCKGYIVQPSDSLSSIAAMFQTTTAELTLSNPALAEGVLSPNTQIVLPPATVNDCPNPEIVTGAPPPPSPPSPPPTPPMPPSPPPAAEPVPVPSPPLVAPAPAEEPAEAPMPVEAPTPAPAPAPEPVVEEVPEEPEVPAPAPAPSSANGLASSALLALLALAGALAVLF